MHYAFRPGARIAGGGDADSMMAALAALEGPDGRLAPETIVEAARPADHPLHAQFTWDDAAAGALYRLQEARTLLRAIIRVADDAPAVPAYVHVRLGAQDSAYYPVAVVAASSDLFARAVAELERKLDAAELAVESLRTFAQDQRALTNLAAVTGGIHAARVGLQAIRA